MILAIIILSLDSGCSSLQNNMSQKNNQFEHISHETGVGNDSFTLKMGKYEESFCDENACILLLSDSVAGCLKGMRAPVLKIEFADGTNKIAKGMRRDASGVPYGCDLVYEYFDFLGEWIRDSILVLKKSDSFGKKR